MSKVFILCLNRRQTGVIFLLLLILSACGYRFSGKENLPSGVERIFVTVFENRTMETGVETFFTDDIIQEFIRNRKDSLANSSAGADAILSGVVESIRIRTISREGTHTPLERRVWATISLKLTGSDGRIIWKKNGISESETYAVMPLKQETERNRLDALSALSKRIAERVYFRLTDDF
jgi:outer membrane lipopolysaccharide assembly protein LptE/RlpB